jgi:hypothetical protein
VVKTESCLRTDLNSVMRLRFFFSSTSLSLPESTSRSRFLGNGVSMFRENGGGGERGGREGVLYVSIDFFDGAVVCFPAFCFQVSLITFNFRFQSIQLRLNP